MISVIILTYNEETNLPTCLNQLKWAKEVFVVDSFSTDQTVEIAKRFGAKVFQRNWTIYYEQMNWALENLPISTEWIFVCDADEWVTGGLANEIQEIALKKGDKFGYYIERKTVFLGRMLKHSGRYPDKVLRLFRRGKGRYEECIAHERFILDGKAGYLRNPLIHDDRRDLFEYLNRHNRYSSLEAQLRYQIKNQGVKSDFRASFIGDWGQRRRAVKYKIWYKLPLRPILRFIWMYFVKFGFMDRKEGFIYVLLASFHEFNINIKYWELCQRKKGR